MRMLLALLFPLLGVLSGSAAAQAVQLTGRTLDGQAFNLEARRGKVVMLFFWNTDCVPCVNKMPELRANAAGWRGKPFELVLISTDRDRQAARGYFNTLRQIEKSAPAMPSLWAGDVQFTPPLSAPTAVPVTWVIDATGKLAKRHAGRIAPEAWDDVAELLP